MKTIIVAFVLLSSMTFAETSPSCKCSKKIRDLAALHRIEEVGLKEINLDNIPREQWKEAINQQQAGILKFRKLVAKVVTDICLRASYQEWMDFFQSNLNDDKKALAQPEAPTFMEQINRDMAEATKCETSGMIPPIQSVK